MLRSHGSRQNRGCTRTRLQCALFATAAAAACTPFAFSAPTGTLRSFVDDRDGTPITGAIVDVSSPAWGRRMTVTGERGRYSLDLVPDYYEVLVEGEKVRDEDVRLSPLVSRLSQ